MLVIISKNYIFLHYVFLKFLYQKITVPNSIFDKLFQLEHKPTGTTKVK